MVRSRFNLCLAGAALFVSSLARAQAPEPDAEAPAALQAPALLEAAPAPYPAGLTPQPEAAEVIVRVTIDTEGRVTEAEVIESAGPELDQAARDAALQYRFAPGLRAGVPVVSRLKLHIAFTPPPVLELPPLEAAVVAAPEPAADSGQPEQVIVHGQQQEAQRLAQSAEAVTVQTLKTARRESAPLAEVLARIPGVSVRRSGGLGSGERLSLNGLSDEQVATFIDTVPLDFSYLTADLGSFPVNLADRIEVYKGVVPVRFGLDALGGAVNLVTDQHFENRLGASAEIGSFGTQRISLGGSYRHEPSGFVASLVGYYDHAKNDYEVEVEVPDADGRGQLRKVPRFHDGYRAYGVAAELGVVDKPWARRLLVQAYAGGSSHELQHNLIMTVPYGEARAGQRVLGSTARYEVELLPQLKLQAVAAYSYRVYSFVDRSEWVYDWFGQRGRKQAVPGETDQMHPLDTLSFRHSTLGRASLNYALAPGQLITLTSSPMYSSQDGESRIERNLREADEITNLNQRLTVVTGLEYESNWLAMPDAARAVDEAHFRLQNRLFGKHYHYHLWAEQQIIGGRGASRTNSSSSNHLGIGDGVRFRFTRWFMLKLSYEYAVRLPRSQELFGDGGQTRSNLDLKPETSHNLNLTPVLDLVRTAIGDLHYELTGFVRDTDDQIVLLNNDRVFKYENVYRSSSLGFETALRWTSPGRYLTLDGSMTLQEFRNRSTEGQFAPFNGDRLPNKPWLFGTWSARLHFEYQRRHRLEPFYIARAVGSFFRGWESRGDIELKQRVPAQLAHTLGVSYIFGSQVIDYAVTFEVQNLADARLYDFIGQQRPGRSYWLKLTGELH
jgi:vitamin B12 transporter